MSKSKINVTIAAKAAAQPSLPLAIPGVFGRITGAFFLVFDSAAVEPHLTNLKSTIYKHPLHGGTQSVSA
jgi:hypothetical protein